MTWGQAGTKSELMKELDKRLKDIGPDELQTLELVDILQVYQLEMLNHNIGMLQQTIIGHTDKIIKAEEETGRKVDNVTMAVHGVETTLAKGDHFQTIAKKLDALNSTIYYNQRYNTTKYTGSFNEHDDKIYVLALQSLADNIEGKPATFPMDETLAILQFMQLKRLEDRM